jgi:hypothetical protein
MEWAVAARWAHLRRVEEHRQKLEGISRLTGEELLRRIPSTLQNQLAPWNEELRLVDLESTWPRKFEEQGFSTAQATRLAGIQVALLFEGLHALRVAEEELSAFEAQLAECAQHGKSPAAALARRLGLRAEQELEAVPLEILAQIAARDMTVPPPADLVRQRDPLVRIAVETVAAWLKCIEDPKLRDAAIQATWNAALLVPDQPGASALVELYACPDDAYHSQERWPASFDRAAEHTCGRGVDAAIWLVAELTNLGRTTVQSAYYDQRNEAPTVVQLREAVRSSRRK